MTEDHKSIETELGDPSVEAEDTSSEITEPYDPSKIRVASKQQSVFNLMRRIENEELNLQPQFQRSADIWTPRNQSRLIESILMGIPLPAFYFDATDPDFWLVVDGLQRLTALSRFMLNAEHLQRLELKPLRLQDLEFLTDIEGQTFGELHRRHQRQIEETQLTAYVIEEGTPDEVKFNVFKRINTGGLPLSSQEIRHALNQGPGNLLLAQLAASEEFKRATAGGISDKRMAGRECVLRFLAFVLVPPERYSEGDFDYFLSAQLKRLNMKSDEKRQELAIRFKRVMEVAFQIFGNDAFRKRYKQDALRSPINKALFEAWAVNLDRLSEGQLSILCTKASALREAFIELNHDRDFERSISLGTGDVKKVRLRFAEIERIIRETLA